MKKIQDNKLYDTDKMKEIFSWESNQSCYEFNRYILYQASDDVYFQFWEYKYKSIPLDWIERNIFRRKPKEKPIERQLVFLGLEGSFDLGQYLDNHGIEPEKLAEILDLERVE